MTDQNPPATPPQYNYVPGNGLAVAALVLGIVGSVIALIPILGLFGLAMGIVAIPLGAMGLRKRKRGETPKGKGSSIAGMILGVLAVVLGIVGLVIVGDAFDAFDAEMQDIQDELDNL